MSDQVPEWAVKRAREIREEIVKQFVLLRDMRQTTGGAAVKIDDLIARALCPPKDHVRLPDGRDVKVSKIGMDILSRMSETGSPWKLCYPFSTRTCDDPRCSCRDEAIEAAQRAKEHGNADR